MLSMALQTALLRIPASEPTVSPQIGVRRKRAFGWKSASFFSHGRQPGVEANSRPSSLVQWAEQQRELSSHLLPFILTVPRMDRCDDTGR